MIVLKKSGYSLVLSSVWALLVCSSGAKVFGQDHSVCPDMSTNQQLLNKGQQYYSEHGGSPSKGFGFPLDAVPPLIQWHPPYKSGSSEEFSVFPRYLGMQNDSAARILSDEGIDRLSLVTTIQIESAQLTAYYYESLGAYEQAQKLYQRILKATAKHPDINQNINHFVQEDLDRINLYKQAKDDENKKQYGKAVLKYQLVSTNIASQKNLELSTKMDLLQPISSKLDNLFLEKHVLEAKVAQMQVQNLYGQYKQRAIGCLHMAEDLDEVAWKLEKNGSYDLAEKMYKQSVEIKEKNLGKLNPYTLSAYGDLARLDSDQGRYEDAQKIYEQTLTSFRKLSNPGTLYVSMLQNYGDMLNRNKEHDKADKIYREAREYLTKDNVSSGKSKKTS